MLTADGSGQKVDSLRLLGYPVGSIEGGDSFWHLVKQSMKVPMHEACLRVNYLFSRTVNVKRKQLKQKLTTFLPIAAMRDIWKSLAMRFGAVLVIFADISGFAKFSVEMRSEATFVAQFLSLRNQKILQECDISNHK